MSRARDMANLGSQAGSGFDASDLTTGTLGNTVQDNITRLGTVTTGTFNGTIGTSATVPASVGSSLVFLEKYTGSDDAQKDFMFSSYTTYNAYLFVLNGIAPVANGSDLYVRLGNSSSIRDAGNDYRIPNRRWYYGGSGTSLTTVDDSVNGMLAFVSSVNSSTNYPGVTGNLFVYRPRNSTYHTSAVFDYTSWTSNDYIYKYSGGGFLRHQEDNTYIRFKWSSDNIQHGDVIMYGVKDA